MPNSSDRDTRPLILRILLPMVPWWAAVTCNILGAVGVVLLALDPDENLLVAGTILGVAVVALYGTALLLWLKKRE